MITYNELKEAVVRKLSGAGYRVYDENVQVSELEQKGALVQVMLEPLACVRFCAGLYEERNVLVDIAWMEEAVSTRAGMYDALDALSHTLQPYLEVQNRKLRVENVRYNITDAIAHVLFDLNFTVKVVEEDTHPMMGELKLGGK